MMSEGYIGITVNPESRFKAHKYHAKTSKSNHRLYNSMRKYDDFEFKILVIGSIEYCTNLEFKLRSKPNIGLNHSVGGIDTVSGRLNYDFTDNVKTKISEGLARAFKENPEYRASVKIRNKGKSCSVDTKQKMSSAHKNKGLKWKNSIADINVWSKADIYYLAYLKMLEQCKERRRKFSPLVFEQISGLVVAKSNSILKSFRAGWIPNLDSDWLKTFKNF